MTNRTPILAPSPLALAFPHIQWDHLGSLRLTSQEMALLRMAETNPVEYTLADFRDASMYARVLLKILSESSSAGCSFGHVSTILEVCNEEQALNVLNADPLGVVTHYAITKLHIIIVTLMADNGVTIGKVFYDGKGGSLIDQWQTLAHVLNREGRSDVFAQSGAALCLVLIIVSSCTSMEANCSDAERNSHPSSFTSTSEALEVTTSWIISQLSSSICNNVGPAIPAMTALMAASVTRRFFSSSGGVKYLCRQLKGKKSCNCY